MLLAYFDSFFVNFLLQYYHPRLPLKYVLTHVSCITYPCYLLTTDNVQLIAAEKLDDENKKRQAVKKVLDGLSPPHFNCLKYLFRYLIYVSKFEHLNNMVIVQYFICFYCSNYIVGNSQFSSRVCSFTPFF